MNLILMADGEVVLRAVVEDGRIPTEVRHSMVCMDCQKVHSSVFEHVGMHDDGEIYKLKEIH